MNRLSNCHEQIHNETLNIYMMQIYGIEANNKSILQIFHIIYENATRIVK